MTLKMHQIFLKQPNLHAQPTLNYYKRKRLKLNPRKIPKLTTQNPKSKKKIAKFNAQNPQLIWLNQS
ncbi:hypothetical protein FGO68_gene13068 [Halteria grandinella]|uniref:Uncharacterized protein n=1 Tax=Halteria grandinella TaxID=5974 RepID=A0A8J8NP57_HALGN|nr:hypothetical protein FGO68_gene13068 [Halteria grandinella]